MVLKAFYAGEESFGVDWAFLERYFFLKCLTKRRTTVGREALHEIGQGFAGKC